MKAYTKYLMLFSFLIFFFSITFAAPASTSLSPTSLDITVIERVLLSNDPAHEAYSNGETTYMPTTVKNVTGKIYINNNANATTLGDIKFTFYRPGNVSFTGIPQNVFVSAADSLGNYTIRVTEIDAGETYVINYTVTNNLPNPPINVSIQYFEYGSGFTTLRNKILANTTEMLEVRINFTNLGDGNITAFYINQTEAYDVNVSWQYTYWYNGTPAVVNGANLTNLPYDVLYWCGSGNEMGTSASQNNNFSCDFYVNTTVNLYPYVETPVLINWQNMTITYTSNSTASGARIRPANNSKHAINVSAVPGTVVLEKYKITDSNYSSDIAFMSNVSPSDPGIKLNVSYLTIWVSGSHDPNNVSLDIKDNTTELVKSFPINISPLAPMHWVNSTNGTGLGSIEMMDKDELRWNILWGNSTQYKRGKVPIYWGRANYTLIHAVFSNLDTNGASGEINEMNYSVYERIYIVKGYILKVKKRVMPRGNNLWTINITIENIGNSWTPLVYAYDLIPQNFTVQVSKIRVFPYDALNESIQHPLNYTGNQSITGSMYKGVAFWWKLNPIANGGYVNITYNVTGSGIYKARELYVVGIDPVQGFGEASITPTAEITQATMAAPTSESVFALLSIIGVAVGTVRRIRSQKT